ncbi:MAG: phosphate acetyltransferase [Campylobacterales bacterium]
MRESLYISSFQEHTGSLIVSMGIMRLLKSRFKKVAFFRPIIAEGQKKDSDINFMMEHFELDMKYEDAYVYTLEDALALISEGKSDEFIEGVIKRFRSLKSRFDFVLVEGFYRSKFISVLDFDVNLELAKNIDAPFLSIISGKDRGLKNITDDLALIKNSIAHYGCKNFATFVNRVDPSLINSLKSCCESSDTYFLEESEDLDKLTINNIREALNAKNIVCQSDELQNLVDRIVIGSMQTSNFLSRLQDKDLLIFGGDREDLLLAAYASYYAKEHPNASGVVLTGGLEPSKSVTKLLKSYQVPLPVIHVDSDTFITAKTIEALKPEITPEDSKKISIAYGVFAKGVNTKTLMEVFEQDGGESIVTPMMFEYALFERAREDKKRIVLPESEDDRILKAADELLKLKVVDITLLGKASEIEHRAGILGLDLSGADIVDPSSSTLSEGFANSFYELRRHKGVSYKDAREFIEKPSYFGVMMVQEGVADGMVSGAIHTTADTVRPALQIIKTKEGINTVSSVFFMCLDTNVLVYGDCAIVQDPSATELAQIAISSAKTAKAFGIEPRVAMLSYSTGDSGSGADVDKVREATKLAKQSAGDILIDGPMQYDAATVPSVATKKMPDSKVAGRANVLIFPDLNTGNNTYKAVQRSSGAIAIGPVLQGLNKPVNDLSRGCLVKDIVNTVAITAIQAQGE